MSQIEIIDPCDRGRHKLEPRFDFEKVGDIVQRRYICDVCTICGHHVPRPYTLRDQIADGVISIDSIWQAMSQGVRFPTLEHGIMPTEETVGDALQPQGQPGAESE